MAGSINSEKNRHQSKKEGKKAKRDVSGTKTEPEKRLWNVQGCEDINIKQNIECFDWCGLFQVDKVQDRMPL